MSDDVTNLVQQMHDYFLQLYAQQNNVSTDNTFLSFEPIGTPITDDMFKLNPSDTTYSRPLAVEQFSKLVNTISPIDGDIFHHTDRQVDDFYNILLAGAQLADSSADNTLFTTIKAEAVRRFEPTVGSLIDETPVPFHPSYPTPDDWYDMSNEKNWTTYTFSSSQTSSSGQTPPIVIHPPIVIYNPWKWRVVPDSVQPILERPDLIKELIATPERASILKPPPLVENRPPISVETTAVNPTSLLTPTISPATSVETTTVNPAFLSTHAVSPVASVEREAALEHLPDHVVSERMDSLPVAVEKVQLSSTNDENIPLKVQPRINESALVARKLAPEIINYTTPHSITSSSIQMTFKYCLVNVNRPWYSSAFLALQGWDVPGYSSGAFSTGTATDNTGFFPTLPVAMLAVKDVQITANWTSDDLKVVRQSAAFGPFSLIGRTMDSLSSTLSCPGTFILGWICQLMSLLPPVSAPTNP